MDIWLRHCKLIMVMLATAWALPCAAQSYTKKPTLIPLNVYALRDQWLPRLPLDKKDCINIPILDSASVDHEKITFDWILQAQHIRMLHHCDKPSQQEREKLWSALEAFRLQQPKDPGLYAVRVHYWIAVGDHDMAKLDMLRLFYLDNDRIWQETVGLAWHLDSYYNGQLIRERKSAEH